MNSKTYIHFDGLNTIRFFSVLAIIIYHSTGVYQEKMPAALKMFFHNLPIGVDMFFIVSGFLICFLLIQEKKEQQTISIAKFYIRRILRIFPLYFFILLIAYIQYHKINPEIVFSKYIFFIGNFWMIATNNWTVGILNPLWSLCIEEQFYLIIPFLIFLIPIKYLKFLFGAIIIISILFRAYITKTVDNNWMTIYCHTLSRCDLLAIGALIAYYYSNNHFKVNINKYVFFGSFIYLLVLMFMLDNTDYSGLIKVTLKKYLFVIPLLVVFLGLVLNRNEDIKSLHWLKKNYALNYLGKISFGLYLYHIPVSGYVAKIPILYNSIFIYTISVTIATILVSSISYELVEKKIISYKSYFETIKTKN